MPKSSKSTKSAAKAKSAKKEPVASVKLYCAAIGAKTEEGIRLAGEETARVRSGINPHLITNLTPLNPELPSSQEKIMEVKAHYADRNAHVLRPFGAKAAPLHQIYENEMRQDPVMKKAAENERNDKLLFMARCFYHCNVWPSPCTQEEMAEARKIIESREHEMDVVIKMQIFN